MRNFLELTLNGLLLAGLYATMSFGLALIYGVMKIINLAHAGFIMLGAFATYQIFAWTGLDPFVSVIIVFPLFLAIGMVLYRFVVSRLPQTGNTPAVQSLLLLFGVWLVLQNVAYYIWTGDTKSIMTSYTMSGVDLFGIRTSVPYLLVFAAAVFVLVVLQFVLTRTFLGKAIRAVTQNRMAGQLVGINGDRTAMIAFGLGTALAALAGSMMAVLYPFTPDFGRSFLLKAFCIIVLGGMESFAGVALGALTVALLEQYAPLMGLQPIFQDALTFGLLVVALVVMPQGLPSVLARMKRGGAAR